MIGDGAGKAVVETTRVNSSFKLHIACIQIMLVKPDVQLFPLLRSKRANRAFDLVYRIQVYASYLNLIGGDYEWAESMEGRTAFRQNFLSSLSCGNVAGTIMLIGLCDLVPNCISSRILTLPHGRGSLLKTQHGTPSVSEGQMTLIFAIRH
jgi:hypothetical protein